MEILQFKQNFSVYFSNIGKSIIYYKAKIKKFKDKLSFCAYPKVCMKQILGG